MESFEQFAMMLESNPMLLLAISMWEALWTLIALWFSGRNDHKGWFIACGLLQLFGIVEMRLNIEIPQIDKIFNFEKTIEMDAI